MNNNFNTILSEQLMILKLLGLISFKKHSNRKSFFLFIYFIVINFIFSTMFIGHGIRMFYNRKFDIFSFCEVLLVQNVSIRYLIVTLKRQSLVKLVNICKNLSKKLEHYEIETMKNFEKIVDFYRKLLLGNIMVIIMAFQMRAYFVTYSSKNKNHDKILPFR